MSACTTRRKELANLRICSGISKVHHMQLLRVREVDILKHEIHSVLLVITNSNNGLIVLICLHVGDQVLQSWFGGKRQDLNKTHAQQMRKEDPVHPTTSVHSIPQR